MTDRLLRAYDYLVLQRPWLVLCLLALVVAGFATQLGKIKLDASADSLMLQGDPSLELYREVSSRYSTEDFLLITWQPDVPLLSPESLEPLRAMAQELRDLEGVSSVKPTVPVSFVTVPRKNQLVKSSENCTA